MSRTNHTPSPPSNGSLSQLGRWLKGAKGAERTRGNSATNVEEEGAGSGKGLADGPRPAELPDAAARSPTASTGPAVAGLDAVASSAAVPQKSAVGIISGSEGLGHATQAAASVDKPLCPPVPPKLGTCVCVYILT